MYIHIGEDQNIRVKDVIAMLDKESANSTYIEEFLNHHRSKIINLSKGPFKSVVITCDHIYLSPLSSGTLNRRSSQINLLNN
ncbi:MAG: DUF370 domain-containing protein [Bacillota bacterium]|nr:DUF370 domain-containing protein [Bacillota bacterium]